MASLRNIVGYFQGRHTTAVTFFSIVGTVLHWFHRLDNTYITFVGTMMGFIIAHSAKEDYFANKNSAGISPQSGPPSNQ